MFSRHVAPETIQEADLRKTHRVAALESPFRSPAIDGSIFRSGKRNAFFFEFPVPMDIAHDLQSIAAQEKALVFPHFDTDRAWQFGVALRDMATTRGLALVIDIRTFGQQLFFSALEGTTPDNLDWARRKGNVVAQFRRSSYSVGLRMQQAGSTLTEKHGLSFADYASHGGAFPLTVSSAGVIGSVTVSGLPQRSDHELVVEALCAHLGHDYGKLALAKV
ncbi:Uncharacterized protein, UPF0303 family [Paraburkholderia megapolitana]|uniref:UPF0303 protein SAMN05192543_107160 n=2 Tax=Burkholderiaceae TaxID=119060 RepID=A0A1I3RD44_9BURK|nr:Uncharacterized protein, UPF0303 family [Paraburkholderia megapolitana]